MEESKLKVDVKLQTEAFPLLWIYLQHQTRVKA